MRRFVALVSLPFSLVGETPMKNLTLRSALTFATALVFAAFMWGCDETAQNPVAPSQTQAGTEAGSGTLVTALHGKKCKGPHKNDPGCDGGDPPDDPPEEPTLYSYVETPGSGSDLEFMGDRLANLSPTPSGPRIVLGDSVDNDQVKLGPGVLNTPTNFADLSCFTNPDLGFINFGGGLRNFGAGVELRFDFHARDKRGKKREYEFRGTMEMLDAPFPPPEGTVQTYKLTRFTVSGHKRGCVGSGVANISIDVGPAP